MSTVTSNDLEIARLRNRLRQLSDNELLRFGLIAKYSCLQGEQEASLRELQEAREEWNRRKPRLPLRGSF
jgi:hypothetical protein